MFEGFDNFWQFSFLVSNCSWWLVPELSWKDSIYFLVIETFTKDTAVTEHWTELRNYVRWGRWGIEFFTNTRVMILIK